MTEQKNTAQLRIAFAALIVGAAATAFNPIFVRLSDLEPGGSAFHRMAWALPVLWLWLGMEWRRSPTVTTTPRPGDRWRLALCGAFFAGDLTALHWSIDLTAVANAILFLNLQPIYVILGAWLLFGERPRRVFLFGAAIALAGTLMMVGQSAEFGGSRLLGDGLGIVAGLCYAGYILTASGLSERYTSATINTWTCTVGAPLLLIAALASGQDILPGSAYGWSLMIGLGVISQAAGQGFIVWGMSFLPAGVSSVALLSAPVAAALFAWLLLNETLTVVQFAALFVVMGGIYMAQRSLHQ